jgi:2-succinyl-6-hydroxy-2,4-cyclohexadiene-1-carboxylate synthase
VSGLTSRRAIRGLALEVAVEGSGPPVLLLHGFTGSAATWGPLARALAESHATIAPSLLGHGRSDAPRDAARYDMPSCVADLLALLDALRVERAAVLGYSMGGRVALHLALAAPARVRALILESASAGIADAAEREARARADAALAASIEMQGVAAFVDRWERRPLLASQASLPAGVREGLRARRMSSDATGLAGSLRGLGAGIVPPVWERLGEIAAPTLVVAGALDEKYRGIGAAMARAIPGARLAIVEGAGHAVHLERPAEHESLVRAFLDEWRDAPSGAPPARDALHGAR